MEMKMVRGITPILLLVYVAIREYFFFSSQISSPNIIIPRHNDVDDQHQSSSATFIYAKPNDLVIFFTFNILVVAVLFGISSSRFSSPPSSTYIELFISSFIDSYEGLKRVFIKDEGQEDYEDGFIPSEVYVEYHEEKEEAKVEGENCNTIVTNCYSMNDGIITEEVYFYGPNYGYGYGYHEYEDELIPGIVDVEYYKEEKVEVHSNGDFCCQKDDHHEDKEKDLFNNDDNDDGDGKKGEIFSFDDEEGMIIGIFDQEDRYIELDDFDLNKRIEEFIDENNKKWREELRNEGLLGLD